MKKKITLSMAFALSLLPMLLNQYGGGKGVQEITGLMNLLNPIGILAVAVFVLGVWVPFRKELIGTVFGALGVTGIVASEVYTFFTWHVLTITGEMRLRHSIRLAFPAFYVGLLASLAMVAVYFAFVRKTEGEQGMAE